LRYRLVRKYILSIVTSPLILCFEVNFAFYLLINRGPKASPNSITRTSWAVALLTFVAVVIRVEIAGLLGLLAIRLLSDGSISFTRLAKVGIISGLASIGTRF
jgi:alpha-1,6-mannosyltransferase